ncbi:phosphate ABC transporter permease PstA [Vibrio tapetis]|uniref:Phosphate transport system permease protein PstA n=1 Tax=Vibrio tapetis subsp. tapetis TaxID=1671868 RepID=A0A2N8ZEZ5_9VIBR|nr:phosphate ABC transporter permease PstA [Vibrio tapetis]SON50489.1 Phosphate ABC transporter, permease protein [Vibrio tapetis subsp. tapetis]
MTRWFKSGAPWIWLTSGAVSISLISVLGILLLIGWKGLAYFWPAPLYQWQGSEHGSANSIIVGQLYQAETVSVERLLARDIPLSKSALDAGEVERLNIKIANRERNQADFISLLADGLSDPTQPIDWAVIEREHNGDFFGQPMGYGIDTQLSYHQLQPLLRAGTERVELIRKEIDNISENQLRGYSASVEALRLERRKHVLNDTLTEERQSAYESQTARIIALSEMAEENLSLLRRELREEILIVKDMHGDLIELPMSEVLDVWYPNRMNTLEKLGHWVVQLGKFLSDSPREGNSEGGVFPAIFGTVFLVMVMSIVVMPLGVVAAIYLNEYAKNNALTRMIRIAVINLAGVPSIVYGVFGLGFFVYTIGGTLDSLFYSESLPTPTFGTPGLLWSALTLALLTLPVVIVATEEGLTRIPSSVRQGSLALGATQLETLLRIVIPMASPAIMTGLILAVARAAGEVAPLMLVGVVKLAPTLPIDSQFPFVHLDRKFMHLGFHIYDVGFQTPNIEAARPLVYATSFLLVTVIVGLNLTAIGIRNNLREKYRTLGQD